MDRGIWAIWYDIATAQRAAYLEWFHEVHIPEKLARPGYLWAAHYELTREGTHPGYLALFGGNSTHTFFNPSPRQLLTRQSAQTKEFMGMRRNSSAAIFAEEVRIDGPAAVQRHSVCQSERADHTKHYLVAFGPMQFSLSKLRQLARVSNGRSSY